MIRVLIADDHQLMRQGLNALLAKAQDIEIVGEARDGQEAIEASQRLQPDVVLMDIEMPRLDGIRATRELSKAGFKGKIVILSMRSDEDSVHRSMQSGASGYLIKNISREELTSAIRSAYEGKQVASPDIAPYLPPEGRAR